MEKFFYEAVITPVGNMYEASIPELGVITQGDSFADAAFMAQDALALAISTRLAEGKTVERVGSFGSVSLEGSMLVGIAVYAEPATILDEWMTTQEAAEILDVSRPRIYAMIESGLLRSRKEGSTRYVCAQDVMDRFNNPVSAGRPKQMLA